MLLWLGAATSPSAVSKFCGILGNGQARPQFLFSCRFLRNDRDEFSVSFQINVLFC